MSTTAEAAIQPSVAEGVLRVPHAYVNWYLLDDADGVTIADAGLPRHWDLLPKALQRIGRRLDDVRALVLTHGHYDHVGFAERARRELRIPVYAPRGEDIYRHPLRFPFERPPFLYAANPGFLKVAARFAANGALRTKGVEEVTEYGDGDELPVPGRPRAIATPGHTPGHTALHLPERDTILTGDALVTLDPYTLLEGPRLVAKAALSDSAQNLASLDRIADSGASRLLPGHGDPWRGRAEDAVEIARRNGTR
jgi:glyoxylase-like metal-dependent hydrolase (beta-lactamase superfamily II)